MQLTPQTYTTSTLADAVQAGCNCVQRKYDGQWVRIEASKGTLRLYDPRGLRLDHGFVETFGDRIPDAVCGTFIGNLLLDHSRIVLWDCWAVCNGDELRVSYQPVEDLAYKERYALLVNQARVLVTGRVPFSVIANHPITMSSVIWTDEAPHTCGLVFRKTTDPVNAGLRIVRRYTEIPGALV